MILPLSQQPQDEKKQRRKKKQQKKKNAGQVTRDYLHTQNEGHRVFLTTNHMQAHRKILQLNLLAEQHKCNRHTFANTIKTISSLPPKHKDYVLVEKKPKKKTREQSGQADRGCLQLVTLGRALTARYWCARCWIPSQSGWALLTTTEAALAAH